MTPSRGGGTLGAMAARRLFLAALAATFVACGGGGGSSDPIDAAAIDAQLVDAQPVDAFVIPVLRNPVTLPDDQLATQAATLLGQGGPMTCNQCHAITRDRLRSWGTQSAAAVTNGSAMPSRTEATARLRNSSVIAFSV